MLHGAVESPSDWVASRWPGGRRGRRISGCSGPRRSPPEWSCIRPRSQFRRALH